MAFRKINSEVFLRISEEILAYSQKCKPFADIFVSEDLMGDLAIQIHYGDEIKEKNLGLN
jgi:hypothetical protein